MCGIIGAVAQRDVTEILLEGLHRMEYRGYDSVGLSLTNNAQALYRARTVGRVTELRAITDKETPLGRTGIAHTRWATHGKPSRDNAHPHNSHNIAIVHNGIIENYLEIKAELVQAGYQFGSETDSEVVAHYFHYLYSQTPDVLHSLKSLKQRLTGAYAIAIISELFPEQMLILRQGSPMVIGVGIGEHFVASDTHALLPVTQRFVYLENGDYGVLSAKQCRVYDQQNNLKSLEIVESALTSQSHDMGDYRHYMEKEIYEQPQAIRHVLAERIVGADIPDQILGPNAQALLDGVKSIRIVACGTSYYAGLVAKFWFEGLAGIACHVEVASEFRYRKHVVEKGCLFLTLSQSGETADTLAALGLAKEQGYHASMTICNVPESTLVRESDLVLMTHAGPEIGVASTKAFTTQLVALLMLVLIIGRRHALSDAMRQQIISQLQSLDQQLETVLQLNTRIEQLAERFVNKHHALFLGRAEHYPIALEGALKLKEISYIHAEAYPAGELKHGPLALVDSDMPVVAVAPNTELLEKLKSNLAEVKARGGQLIVFADSETELPDEPGVHIETMHPVDEVVAPIVHVVPLQLLAYHCAVLKGTDVDRPRNLAKSVTVE